MPNIPPLDPPKYSTMLLCSIVGSLHFNDRNTLIEQSPALKGMFYMPGIALKEESL